MIELKLVYLMLILGHLAMLAYAINTIPQIPTQFKFSEESTVDSVTSYYRDLVYSETFKAVRYEKRNPKPDASSFYSSDSLITVHDFNVGVSFTINRNMRNCSMTPLSATTFDSDLNFTNGLFNADGSYVIRLKSAKSFLLLDFPYSYDSRTNLNGIDSDLFTASPVNNTVIKSDFGFSADELTVQQENGKGKNVPIYLKTIDKANNPTYSYFIGFDKSQDLRPFDVSECFDDVDDSDIKDFVMKFKVKNDLGENPDINTITNIFTQALMKATNETFTRFSRPRLGVSDDGYLYARASILPRAPALSYFTRLDGYWILSTPTAEPTKPAVNVEQCAGYCVRNIRCLSFDYSLNTKNCYLNARHSVDGKPSTLNGLIHHSRNTLDGFYAREIFEIFDTLKNRTINETFMIEVNGKTYVAESFDLASTTNNRYGTTENLRRFDLKLTNKKFPEAKDKTILGVSIDDCAKACREEIGFECLSFDFCYLHGDCRLSRLLADNDTKYYVDSTECDIYEKDPLYHYTLFPSKTLINPNDIKYTSVKTPAECASKCDNELNIHCRSFNFCPEQNLCLLTDKHLADSTQDLETDLACSHYSRDFLSDFAFTSSAVIPLYSDVIYDGSTLDQCSVQCVSADGFNCKSFDFCPESKTCLLNSGYKTKPDPSASHKTDTCYNYKREYFYTTGQKETSDNGGTSDNTGVLVALSIIFALLSVAGGVAVGIVYLRKSA